MALDDHQLKPAQRARATSGQRKLLQQRDMGWRLELTCRQTEPRGIHRQAQNSLVREMLISALLPRKRMRILCKQQPECQHIKSGLLQDIAARLPV